MNLEDLIKRTAERAGATQYQTRKIIRSMMKEIMTCMARHEELEMKGYLSFRIIEKPPRNRTTPQGKKLWWPASKRIRVLPGAHIKRAAGIHVRDLREKDDEDFLPR